MANEPGRDMKSEQVKELVAKVAMLKLAKLYNISVANITLRKLASEAVQECEQDEREAALASLSSSETGARESEVAWLIERGGLCLGFCDGYKFAWVTFTNEKALRFSRMADAFSFKETMRWEQKKWEMLAEARVTEHMWLREDRQS